MRLFPTTKLSENFEGGEGAPWTFSFAAVNYGTGVVTLDTTGKITGNNSLKFENTGEAGLQAQVLLAADREDIYGEFSFFLPAGFNYGAAGYFTLADFYNLAVTSAFWFNVDQSVLYFGRTGGATVSTGLAISSGVAHTIRFYIKKNTSTGRVKVWLDNATAVEASPSYDSGAINTGASTLRYFRVGKPYAPNTVGDVYIDNVSLDDVFTYGGISLMSANTHAMKVSRLNAARLGASRLDYYQPYMKFVIDGVDQTAKVRIEGCTLTQAQDGQPWSMQVTVSGFVPEAGNSIRVYIGELHDHHLLFRGTIMKVKTSLEGEKTSLVVYHLECLDQTWALNKSIVNQRWTSNSITAIVQSVVTLYAGTDIGTTLTGIETGLPTLDEFTATNERVSDILDRLAALAGAHWHMEATSATQSQLIFTTQSGTATTTIEDTMHGLGVRNVAHESSIGERQTYVFARGGGSAAVVSVPAGSTHMPVADVSWFPTTQDLGFSGSLLWLSYLESGTNRMQYANCSNSAPYPSTLLTQAYAAGATTMNVANYAGLDLFDGWLLIDGMYVTYSSYNIPAGTIGAVFGIPASGYGALTANVAANTVVTMVPRIRGITIMTHAIPAGQEVNILYRVQDGDAITDFNSDLGGTFDTTWGSSYGFITDGRWGHAETKARALALLEARKNNFEQVTFTTRDTSFNIGREVTFNLTAPAIEGTYKIQSVSMSEFGKGPASFIFPLRQVTATSQRYSFENLVKSIRRAEEKRG